MKLEKVYPGFPGQSYKLADFISVARACGLEHLKAWLHFWNFLISRHSLGMKNKLSEATYARKSEQIANVICNDDFVMKYGETGCEATKNNKILNIDTDNDETIRKSDLIIIHKRDDTEIEFSNIEFKKSAVLKQTKMCQNSKNTRINACILYDLMSVTQKPDIKVITIDWNGREGCLYEVNKFESCVVASPISPVFIPKRLDELLHFKVWADESFCLPKFQGGSIRISESHCPCHDTRVVFYPGASNEGYWTSKHVIKQLMNVLVFFRRII